MNSYYKKYTVKKKYLIISVFVLVICACVSILLLLDKKQPEGYNLLFLLPLTYGILNVLFCSLYKYTNNIGILAIYVLEGFRMVITPLCMYFGDYYSVFYKNISNRISFAVALMIYEAVIVFVVMAWANHQKYKERGKVKRHIKYKSLKPILFFLVLFLIGVAVLFPNSTTSFKTIFDMKNDDFTTWTGLSAARYSVGSLERILTTLFTMVFSWVRYLLPTAVIIWCRKKIGNNTLSLLLSGLTIIIQMLFITATIMDSILCAFILFLVLGKCYPDKKKVLIVLAVSALFIVIGFYFTSRYFVRIGVGGDMWKFVSENANAYVGGVANVAAMFNVSNEFKSSTFFYNIYGAIPFNSTLFGLSGDKLSAVFNMVNGRNDGQIPPTIGAGWYYFTVFFAPLESAIYTRLAVMFGKKGLFEKNIWRYVVYILVTLMMVMGFTTYNSAIVLNYTTTLLIPLLFLSSLTDDDEFNFR